MFADNDTPKGNVGTLPTIDDVLAGDLFGEAASSKGDVMEVVKRVVGEALKLPLDDRAGHVIVTLSPTLESMDRSLSFAVINAITRAGIMNKTDAKAFVGDCVATGKERERRRAAEERRQNKDAKRAAALASRVRNTIEVNDSQMIDVRSKLLGAVVSANELEPAAPVLYLRNGMLVRVKRNEKNLWSIDEIKTNAMKNIMADVADWITVTETETDYKEVAVFPPESVASDFLAMPEWFGLPSLAEIVECPVFTVEGQLHDTPGYSEHSRMYYTGGAEVGNTEPTAERVAWAKSLLLDDLLVDFPFAEDASKAHAVAYILAPFVRDMVTGPVPPTLVEAPMEGSGKSLLTNACAFPALGRTLPTMAFTNNDEELDKRVVAKLLAGDTHAVLDNVNYELDSGVLANAWTQTVYEGRFLGKSTQMKLENRMIWAVTANNIVLSAENARRCVWVHLDANVERPRDRDGFKHPHLMTWIAENRNDLVTACVTLVRAWIDAGMPAYQGTRRKGSFESWVAVMGGILDVIGVPAFLDNEDELAAKAVTKTNLMGDFVNAWWDRHGKRDTSPADLFHIASYYDNEPSIYSERSGSEGEEANPFTEPAGVVRGLNLLDELLPSPKERGRQIQLGKLLNKHQDRVVSGLKIVKSKAQKGQQFWRLEDPTGQRSEPMPVIPSGDVSRLVNGQIEIEVE